ncbi:MAG: hypothetical protein LBK06_09605 [Planctomycetaceae bacterium]|jgi:hypothetical protein|nr:hypothetical protein [Planctomycetaceae bacterium]
MNEGILQFDFSGCGVVKRFDSRECNCHGLKAVDFFVESDDCLYFVEVKDYQNPNTPPERRKDDYKMLCEAIEKKDSVFCLEMGAKIKDSLLRCYAMGDNFCKRVVYLLFIRLDGYGSRERGRLKEKISGHVPTGLNDKRFDKFKEISFELVNAEQLKQFGITCTTHRETVTKEYVRT